MTDDEMDDAIEEVKSLMEEKAGTDHMTQAEAVEFYRGCASEANQWAQIIESEME